MSILADFNPPFLPFSLVRECFIDTGVADFAEIGDGCSLRNALKQPFKEYHGIEISKRHYDAAVQRAARECGMPTTGGTYSTWFICQGKALTLHHGSSPDVLRLQNRGTWDAEIGAVLDPAKSTTIWCDAHWQGLHDRPDEMDPRYGECPLLAELRAILAVPWRVPPIILIDDINTMASDKWWSEFGRGYDRKQWPSLNDIYDTIHPQFTIAIHNGVLYSYRR